MKTVMAFDTTGHGGAVVVAAEGKTLAESFHDPQLGYAEELFGLMDRALESACLRWDELDAVAVIEGPGSYTGLRIGIMTAKTLAHAHGIPLLTVGTLELLAGRISLQQDGQGILIPCADAGARHVFAEIREAATHKVLREMERVALGDLTRWIEGLAGPRVFLPWGAVCPGILKEEILRGTPHGIEECPSLARELAVLASLGRPPVRRVDPMSLVPLYGSVSQAERVHDVDLSEQVHEPIPPTNWQ